jgi:hypothetical protein
MEGQGTIGEFGSNPLRPSEGFLDNSKFWLSTFVISIPFILALFYAGLTTASKSADSITSMVGLILVGLSTVLNIIVFVTINYRLRKNINTFPLQIWTASFVVLLLGVIVVSSSYKNVYTCSLNTSKVDNTPTNPSPSPSPL